MFLPGETYKRSIDPDFYVTITEFDVILYGRYDPNDSAIIRYQWKDSPFNHLDTQRHMMGDDWYAYNPAGDHAQTPTRN
jgi:hypothetical protein